jgi:hypothetical protein
MSSVISLALAALDTALRISIAVVADSATQSLVIGE